MEFKRCYNCMRELDAPGAVCPHCGFDNTSDLRKQPGHMLKCGTILDGRYVVGRSLGQGGFGITYIGYDLRLDIPVCIKEYYPEGAAMRTLPHSGIVYWGTSENAQGLKEGRQSFVREAQKADKLRDLKHIVSVWAVFYENETAYIVMDYIEGETLGDRLVRTQKLLGERECTMLMAPVMQDLEQAHARGIIHRDIKPDNLMYTLAGQLMLLDMGAAKDLAASTQRTSSMTSVRAVSQGFSPLEQYRAKGMIGPWTDVYAMCATIYYCTTGRVLPTPMDRISGIKVDYSSLTAPFAAVLEKGLAVKPEDRCQSMQALLEELTAAAGITLSKPRGPEKDTQAENTQTQAVKSEPAASARKKNGFHPWMILAAVLLVAGGFLLGRLFQPDMLPVLSRSAAKETTVPASSPAVTPEAAPTATPEAIVTAAPEPTPAATPEPAAEADAGTLYERGQAFAEAGNYAEALEWYLKAAEAGSAEAMRKIGGLYREGNGVEPDNRKALEWYRKAADAGDAPAMYNVGNYYVMGIVVEQDYHEALRWYTRSADGGFASAMTAIGAIYEQGFGVEKDGHEALMWYEKAAEAGDATAMNNIGILYADGRILEQNFTAALEWLRRAADNGSGAGARNLGLMYYLGHGVEQDYAQALAWFLKAADLGDAAAMHMLGNMYQFGEGTEADVAKADEWHMRALEAGYTA